MTQRIAITCGEPAGIGPDLTVLLAQQAWPAELVVCADKAMLAERAKQLQLPLTLLDYDPREAPTPTASGSLRVLHIECPNKVIAGQLDTGNSHYVVETLRRAGQGSLNGEFAAIVTGPVNKSVINQAGINFSGHTEYFAQQAGCDNVVMMLATEGLRVALVTTHLPLADVPKAITATRLSTIIHILHHDLVTKFNLAKPRILVCGLNPHAGENGHLGHEEQLVIEPTLAALRESHHYQLDGPLPADTIFQPKYLADADVVLAMYHDQGLPVLKYKGFGAAVNITLGLPFIRTSVDHGTALDLAGSGDVHPGSFQLAIEQALSMAKQS